VCHFTEHLETVHFDVSLTVHLNLILANLQLDAQILCLIISLLQSSGAPDGHLQRVTVPDAVLIQFDLLMTSTTVLETCSRL
jgi:hypothetical protein